MAAYKYDKFLGKSSSEAYDQTHEPGGVAPHAGIYRCTGCGREIGIAQGHILPPQNHHQHTTSAAIKWQLIVYADHQPK